MADPIPGQKHTALVDPFGRRLHYLRLSVTDRCNLRCSYCMPQNGVRKLRQDQVLSLEEIARVAQAAVALGVDKIRLTGGEPLLRRDFATLLGYLHRLSPRPDLRLTTNGLLLAQNLPLLRRCKVSTVNVSLDTLKPERYGQISGLGPARGPGAWRRVFAAVEQALAAGRPAIKLNVVLQAGVNEDEIEDFARLSQRLPLAVRFIEYMPVGRRTPFDPKRFLAADEVVERLGALGELCQLPMRRGDGPAQRFALSGSAGELGVISAVSNHFCGACNRLRLTAHGHLVPCLFSDPAVDLRPILRSNASDEALKEALLQAAAAKPAGHGQSQGRLMASGCFMSRLGG